MLTAWRVPVWAVLLVFFGFVLVLTGGLVVTDDYAAATMLEVGSALFLAVPLVFVERFMAGIREEVKSVKEDVQAEIESLGKATGDLIADARAADTSSVRELQNEGAEPIAWRLLRRAQYLGAIDRRGVRVRLPDSDLRVRFAPEATAGEGAGAVVLSVEGADGGPLAGDEVWSPTEPAAIALSQLAQDLQRVGRYPGDSSFNDTEIVDRLGDTLDAVIALRTGGRRGAHLAPVVELNGDWAITVDGLAHIDDDLRKVDALHLLSDPGEARADLLDRDSQVDESEQLRESFATAGEYHAGEHRRAAESRIPRPN